MFKNVFSFSGRIRRTEYGVSYILVFVSMFGWANINSFFEVIAFHILVQLIAIYWFLFSQGSKRCHDMGKSGFYQLIPFYFFAMILSEGENRSNKYGQDPKLVELREKELSISRKNNSIEIPGDKQIETIASELISGILLIVLAIALLTYFIHPEGWPYFIVESLLVVAGYYLMLVLGFKREIMPKSSKFFILHRAIFSIGFYIVLLTYKTYSYNLTDFNILSIGEAVSYILSIYILTYIPYYIFNKRKTLNPILLEA